MAVIAKLGRGPEQQRKRRRLRKVALLPTMFTLGNLICGFAAAQFCLRAMLEAGAGIDSTVVDTLNNHLLERLLPSFLSIAAGFIFLGMLCDMLDGRIARITRSTTDFGGQLDSLADVVTFGVAPALLIIALLMKQPEVASAPGPLSVSLSARAVWMMSAVYVACAGLRLARFNVENDKTDAHGAFFRGLPSPGAATLIAALVLFHENLRTSRQLGETVGSAIQPFIVAALPWIAFGLGLLMVSRVRYRHVANSYLKGRRSFEHVVAMVIVLGIFVWYKELTLSAVALVYVLSGPGFEIVQRFRRDRSDALSDANQVAHSGKEPDKRSAGSAS